MIIQQVINFPFFRFTENQQAKLHKEQQRGKKTKTKSLVNPYKKGGGVLV